MNIQESCGWTFMVDEVKQAHATLNELPPYYLSIRPKSTIEKQETLFQEEKVEEYAYG